jgi:glycopeptide antibiotics resistance protein
MNMKKSVAVAILLLAYLWLLVKVMVLKDIAMIRIGTLMLNFGGTHEGEPNWVPFKTILFYLFGDKGLIIAGINLVGNIIFLVPVGFLVPIIFPSMNGRKAFVLAVLSGLSIECLQVILHVGIFDIDDVILNGFGVMIGYWAYRYLPLLWQKMKTSKVILGTVVVVCIGMVVLGYDVYQETQRPGPIGPGPGGMMHPDAAGKKGLQSDDPCGGTGGTGEIVRIGKDDFVIRRKDGVEQTILISKETTIRSAKGEEAPSVLVPGMRVTLVTNDSDDGGRMIAAFVLVCKMQ